MNKNDTPYRDTSTPIHGMFVRKFAHDIPPSELIWHMDEHDRLVRVVSGTGWHFQFDEDIPFELVPDRTMFIIPSMMYHRLIKPKRIQSLAQEDNDLILRIFEVDA